MRGRAKDCSCVSDPLSDLKRSFQKRPRRLEISRFQLDFREPGSGESLDPELADDGCDLQSLLVVLHRHFRMAESAMTLGDGVESVRQQPRRRLRLAEDGRGVFEPLQGALWIAALFPVRKRYVELRDRLIGDVPQLLRHFRDTVVILEGGKKVAADGRIRPRVEQAGHDQPAVGDPWLEVHRLTESVAAMTRSRDAP